MQKSELLSQRLGLQDGEGIASCPEQHQPSPSASKAQAMLGGSKTAFGKEMSLRKCELSHMGRQKSGRFKLHLRNFNRNARKKIKAGNQHRDWAGCTGCNSRGGQSEGQLPLRAKPGSLEEGIPLQRDVPPSHPVLKAALRFFFSSKAQAAAPASCRHLHPLSGICSQTQRCRSLACSRGFIYSPGPTRSRL